MIEKVYFTEDNSGECYIGGVDYFYKLDNGNFEAILYCKNKDLISEFEKLWRNTYERQFYKTSYSYCEIKEFNDPNFKIKICGKDLNLENHFLNDILNLSVKYDEMNNKNIKNEDVSISKNEEKDGMNIFVW